MKNLKMVACGAALLTVLSVPAFAGVTGTEGGTSTHTENRQTNIQNRTVSTSVRYLANIIRDQGRRITDTESYNRVNRTVVNGVNGREYGYNSRQQWAIGDRIETDRRHTGSDSWLTFLRYSYEQIGDNFVGSNYTQVGTTYRGTQFDGRDVTQSADLIVIGDSDNLGSQFVAQGSRTIVDNFTDFYWRDLHREDVRQKVFNKYADHKKTTVHYYTKYVDEITYISPIVLNMDGTGKLMASNGNHRAHDEFFTERLAIFDFYGTGEPRLMEWVGESDGLLCVPKADGRVDGTCLFGTANGYSDGYEELAVTRDKNGDGVVSGSELDGLYVWQDRNGNAIAGSAELKTVQELGITEISTKHNKFQSTFKMNGKTGTAWDWWPTIRGLKKMVPPAQG